MLDKKIIVFDGLCILCNSFVQFIVKKDRTKQFYFTNAQSEFIKENVEAIQLNVNPLESVIYLKNGIILKESSAVLGIISDLGGLWKLTLILRLVPTFFRDFIYRFCAGRRYKIFGKLESCISPGDDWKHRFLP